MINIEIVDKSNKNLEKKEGKFQPQILLSFVGRIMTLPAKSSSLSRKVKISPISFCLLIIFAFQSHDSSINFSIFSFFLRFFLEKWFIYPFYMSRKYVFCGRIWHQISSRIFLMELIWFFSEGWGNEICHEWGASVNYVRWFYVIPPHRQISKILIYSSLVRKPLWPLPVLFLHYEIHACPLGEVG